MTSHFIKNALAPLFAALMLAGCASAPAVAPSFASPAQFKEQTATLTPGASGTWTRRAPAEAQL